MAGGLINLVSYGFNDLYLTGSPQITFFKIVYRRHTNFSRESIAIPCNDMNFGDEVTIPFPKIGDLMSNVFLQFQIPEIHLFKTDLATDLTNTQTQFLTTSLPINMSSDEQSIASDYQSILAFLAINTAGYRIAVDTQSIINQSVSDFVQAILNVLQYQNQDVVYDTALSKAFQFETTNGNPENTSFLNSAFSDIKKILNTLPTDPSILRQNYSISDVMALINNAINTCIQVKGYYFSKIKKLHTAQSDANSLYAKFAWVQRLGFAMIDRVEIRIGGEMIDRHYGDWMNIWFELTTSTDQARLFDQMLGNITELTTFDRNDKPTRLVSIPLNFWFCRRLGLTFPLVALQYSPVSLTIRLKTFEECAYVETLPSTDSNGNALNINQMSLSDIWDNQGFSLSPTILVEYIYLDNLERKRFAQSAHEYLIETVDVLTFNNITSSDLNIDLGFSGPSKELIWTAQKMAYINNDTTLIKYPFTYSTDMYNPDNPLPYLSRPRINPINNVQLFLNGKERFPFSEQMFFNVVQPLTRHTSIPSTGINLYSFSLYPEEHQPSGTCNFTVLSEVSMTITLNQSLFSYFLSDIDPNIEFNSDNDAQISTDAIITVYSRRYNVLRFIGGFGAFAYSYNAS